MIHIATNLTSKLSIVHKKGWLPPAFHARARIVTHNSPMNVNYTNLGFMKSFATPHSKSGNLGGVVFEMVTIKNYNLGCIIKHRSDQITNYSYSGLNQKQEEA